MHSHRKPIRTVRGPARWLTVAALVAPAAAGVAMSAPPPGEVAARAAEVRDDETDDDVLIIYDLRDVLAPGRVVGAEESPLLAALRGVPSRYVVSAGETGPMIAARLTGDAANWPLIAEHNGLPDPADLKVGQVLVVPALRATNLNPRVGTKQFSTAEDVTVLLTSELELNAGDPAGSRVQIEARGDHLVVRASARDHGRVATLLTELRASRLIMVDVQCRFLTGLDALVARGGVKLELPPEGVNGRAGAITLTARQLELINSAQGEVPAASVLAAPRLLLVNGQRASISIASLAEVAVPGAELRADRVTIAIEEGFHVVLDAAATPDRRSVRLNVRPTGVSLDLTTGVPIERRVEADLDATVPDRGAALIRLSDASLRILGARTVVEARAGELRWEITREAAESAPEPVYVLICPRLVIEPDKGEVLEPPPPGR